MHQQAISRAALLWHQQAVMDAGAHLCLRLISCQHDSDFCDLFIRFCKGSVTTDEAATTGNPYSVLVALHCTRTSTVYHVYHESMILEQQQRMG